MIIGTMDDGVALSIRGSLLKPQHVRGFLRMLTPPRIQDSTWSPFMHVLKLVVGQYKPYPSQRIRMGIVFIGFLVILLLQKTGEH